MNGPGDIQKLLDNYQISYKLVHYSQSAKDAKEASREIGISVDRMLKTLLVRCGTDYVLLLLPSTKQVNFYHLKEITAKTFSMASPQEVNEITGYTIGSVSPMCLKTLVPVYIDKSSLTLPQVGIGSGIRGVEIILNPTDLQKVTKAVACVLTQ